MRILIHGIHFLPDLIGIGRFTGDMAWWLALQGHQVRVVVAPPFYPEWKVAKGYSWWRFTRQKTGFVLPKRVPAIAGGDLSVCRCPIWVPAKPTGIKRILHFVSFALCSFPVMLMQCFWRPNVVLVIEPTLFCGPQAWLVARLSGARAWLHIQDLEVDAAFEMGLLPSGLLSQFAYAVERFLLRRFDQVSTISVNMLTRLKAKGVAKGVLFPNWVDTEAIFPLSRVSSIRQELGLSDDLVVALYSGNMATKQGLEILIEAARSLAGNASIRFIICGDGPAKARLQDLALGLDNIMFLPLQPIEKLNDLLNLGDIHLLPQLADVADLVMPSKLTGMLASGRPVVATAAVGTQVEEVVRGRGIIVKPGDILALAAAVGALAVNSEMRQKFGQAAREYALANLSKEAVLRRVESDLVAVLR
ncbi:MAG: glycosyltransferase WbuB [Proteobacteria bacterium]|nr:glycosyltransferase WbuB [Pseudomonadota bacterium]